MQNEKVVKCWNHFGTRHFQEAILLGDYYGSYKSAQILQIIAKNTDNRMSLAIISWRIASPKRVSHINLQITEQNYLLLITLLNFSLKLFQNQLCKKNAKGSLRNENISLNIFNKYFDAIFFEPSYTSYILYYRAIKCLHFLP